MSQDIPIFELTTFIPSIDLTLQQIIAANKLHFAHFIYDVIYHISILLRKIFEEERTMNLLLTEDTFYTNFFTSWKNTNFTSFNQITSYDDLSTNFNDNNQLKLILSWLLYQTDSNFTTYLQDSKLVQDSYYEHFHFDNITKNNIKLYNRAFLFINDRKIYKCKKFMNPSDNSIPTNASNTNGSYTDICQNADIDYDDEYKFINEIFNKIDNSKIKEILFQFNDNILHFFSSF
jgi:hypothetical protein